MPGEIPFTQYQQPQQNAAGNPLQNMEHMQNIMSKAQAFQQQQLENNAKMGLGQLMQQHVNPETGDVDINGLLVDAASHPDVAVLFPQISKDALANKLTTQQILGAQLENARKKQEFTATTAASYLDKYAKTGEKPTTQDIAGIYGEMVAAGVLTREEALKGIVAASGSKMSPEQMIRNLAMRSAQGLAMMDSSMQSLKTMYNPVEGVTTEGVPYKAPMGASPLAPPGSRIAAGAGSAPSTPGARQETLPSESPATSGEGLPPGAMRTGQSQEEQAAIGPYKEYQEGKGPMRDFEADINAKLQTAQAINMRLQETAKALEKFKTGPGTKIKYELAKTAAMFDREDLASRLLGGGKDALAAAQEVEKLVTRNSFEELKTALGGQGRFTNLEVENFMRSNFNLDTKPEAIESMMNFTKSITDLAEQEAELFQQYKKSSFSNKRSPNSFNPGYFSNKFMEHLRRTNQIQNGRYSIKQPGGE